MIVVLQQAVISILSAVIGGFIVIKLAKRELKQEVFNEIPVFIDEIKAYAEEWINGETGQKALWQIGGLIGNGAKSGFGLNKSGGKKGFEGLVVDLVGGFLKSKVPMLAQNNGETSQPQPQRQNLNRA